MLERYSNVHYSHAPAAHPGFLQGISIAETHYTLKILTVDLNIDCNLNLRNIRSHVCRTTEWAH